MAHAAGVPIECIPLEDIVIEGENPAESKTTIRNETDSDTSNKIILLEPIVK